MTSESRSGKSIPPRITAHATPQAAVRQANQFAGARCLRRLLGPSGGRTASSRGLLEQKTICSSSFSTLRIGYLPRHDRPLCMHTAAERGEQSTLPAWLPDCAFNRIAEIVIFNRQLRLRIGDREDLENTTVVPKARAVRLRRTM